MTKTSPFGIAIILKEKFDSFPSDIEKIRNGVIWIFNAYTALNPLFSVEVIQGVVVGLSLHSFTSL